MAGKKDYLKKAEVVAVVGICRDNVFSPNHIKDDLNIFKEVTSNLRKRGIMPKVIKEKDFVEEFLKADVVYSMARDTRTLEKLMGMEWNGTLAINSSYGVKNCSRTKMTELLLGKNIPYPKSDIISIDEEYTREEFPCWVKRGDSHAIIKNDVAYAANKKDLKRIFKDFRSRDIHTAVINEHLQGDLIKFYGVKDTDFFYWFYPSPCSHSKFGLEKVNGVAKGYKFDEDELKRIANCASEVLKVQIYGGDCVVSADGDIKIIDFNDWPSFARCHKEASESIAQYIYDKIIEVKDKKNDK